MATAKKDVIERENARVEFEDGVAWLYMNRPKKLNAMSPALNRDMMELVDLLEGDDRCGVLVLTGAGESFAAGMDLKEYFRELDGKGRHATIKTRRVAYDWQWHRLMFYEKPTIAMVNGWCFGGAFSPLVGCDLAIAADEAQFGLSEINWGILPAGNVTKAVAMTMNWRQGLYYIMTGATFDGKKAAELGLVNESVPLAQLKKRTREVADTLLGKDPDVLKAAKDCFKRVRDLPLDVSEDFITAKLEQMFHINGMQARNEGMRQFLEDKTVKPGLAVAKFTKARGKAKAKA
jgi:trans-feruloyl-CoA hydratase/vanillin synthase